MGEPSTRRRPAPRSSSWYGQTPSPSPPPNADRRRAAEAALTQPRRHEHRGTAGIALPRCSWRRAGSGQLLQPGAGQQVGGGDGGGVCPYQLDQGGAGDLRGEQRALLLEVLLLGLAGAGRVGPDRRPAEPVSGVNWGSTAVKVMSRPARLASSWAYPVMKRWVALAPA